MFTRRQICMGSAALLTTNLMPHTSSLAKNTRNIIELKALPGKAQLFEPGAPMTPIWGYNGIVPGPEIRTKQGDIFKADLINGLEQPTTIHWHGIRIDNKMDGVAGLTQPPVKPNERFEYRFTPPDAGTYWYHPHYRTWEQLARGLSGAFIVEEDSPPKVDLDKVMIFDDWRLENNGLIHERSLGSLHEKSHAGRLGNVITLNGKDTEDVVVKHGQRLRLRLINAATARIMGISFEDHEIEVIALDGQPTKPFKPSRKRVTLTPAQRADIIVDCTQDIGMKSRILVHAGREALRLGDLVYDKSQRQRSKVLTDPYLLSPNPMPTDLKLEKAVEVTLEMTGGARSNIQSAIYQGKNTPIRELARKHGKVWAFNGISGKPEKPIGIFERGQTVKFVMNNLTRWPHAMHFHGHHVKEVEHSKRAASPHWRDTIFMAPQDVITVAFIAHNPGRWMLHCHMLEHQAGGMGTWYEVV